MYHLNQSAVVHTVAKMKWEHPAWMMPSLPHTYWGIKPSNEIVKTPKDNRTQQTLASSNLTHRVFTHKHVFSGIWRWKSKEVPLSRNHDYLSEGLACITGLASELCEPPGEKWLVSLASHFTTKCKGLLSRLLTFDFIFQLCVRSGGRAGNTSLGLFWRRVSLHHRVPYLKMLCFWFPVMGSLLTDLGARSNSRGKCIVVSRPTVKFLYLTFQ